MDTHRRRLLALAGPVYLQLLAGVVAGIVDVLWVTSLGASAVAAVAAATTVEAVLLGVILMTAQGTTVRTAAAMGAGDGAAIRGALRGGLLLFALLTPAVAGGGWLLREPLAELLLGGSGARATELATGYFAIALPGIVVFYGQWFVDGILKGTGDTRTPMHLALLANALILVLDPLLIFGRLGLPELGIQGAALATVLGRVPPLLLGLLALRRSTALRSVRGDRADGPARASVYAEMLRTVRIGLPMSSDFLIRMAGSLGLVVVVARLGVVEAAGYGIALKAMYVATMGFYAVRQAASIHTAHTLGAGRDERRAVGRQAVVVSLLFGLVCGLALLAAAPWVMRLFGAEADVADAGALMLRCVTPYLLVLACFIALGGVFEGSGRAGPMAGVTAAGTVVLLPLAAWLTPLGLPGICAAMALSTGLQYGVVEWLFRRALPRGQVVTGAVETGAAETGSGVAGSAVATSAVAGGRYRWMRHMDATRRKTHA
ncbi:MATE family efflux transporter [Streptomyces sp. NPDC051940]|uniref:MATE family efflux transporter n=1 Tax=Streptomyces sp. NPDC051940 TaxID=3155675 RepID=UPI00341ECF05